MTAVRDELVVNHGAFDGGAGLAAALAATASGGTIPTAGQLLRRTRDALPVAWKGDTGLVAGYDALRDGVRAARAAAAERVVGGVVIRSADVG